MTKHKLSNLMESMGTMKIGDLFNAFSHRLPQIKDRSYVGSPKKFCKIRSVPGDAVDARLPVGNKILKLKPVRFASRNRCGKIRV